MDDSAVSPRPSRALLLVGALVLAAVGSVFAVRSWLGGREARRAAVTALNGAGEALTALERCLAGGATVDVIAAMAFRAADDCDTVELASAVEGLPPGLAERVRAALLSAQAQWSVVSRRSSRSADGLVALCEYLGTIHAALDEVAAALEQPQGAPAPSCSIPASARRAAVVAPPGYHAGTGRVYRVEERPPAVTASWTTGSGRLALARTVDATTWTVHEAPEGLRWYDWNEHGLVAITDSPRVVHVHEGGVWSPRGAVEAAGVLTIEALPGDGVLVFTGSEDTFKVLRSRDGGRTFAAAPSFRIPDYYRHARHAALDDGTFVVLTIDKSDPWTLTSWRSAPDGALSHTGLSWSGPRPELAGLDVCRHGSSHWAVVHGRQVAVTLDDGARWQAVGELGAPTAVERLRCTGSALAILSGDHRGRGLWLCSVRGCDEPVQMPTAGAALRFAPDPQLWVFPAPPLAPQVPVRLFRVERGALAPERVLFVTPGPDSLPVVDSDGFVDLDAGGRGAY